MKFSRRVIAEMINQKHQHIAFAFIMALLMSCIMSFIVSVFNAGFVNDILIIWLKAWCIAFVVAFPLILLVSPAARKLVGLITKE